MSKQKNLHCPFQDRKLGYVRFVQHEREEIEKQVMRIHHCSWGTYLHGFCR